MTKKAKEMIFQVFGNFGVSIDGEILSDGVILYENGEYWEERLEDVENPFFKNSQEFFEWENLKERLLETNLYFNDLLNKSRNKEVVVLDIEDIEKAKVLNEFNELNRYCTPCETAFLNNSDSEKAIQEVLRVSEEEVEKMIEESSHFCSKDDFIVASSNLEVYTINASEIRC